MEKVNKAIKAIGRYFFALVETIVSAIIIMLLYVIYIPFGICRALFDRKMTREFYDDVFYVIDSARKRMRGKGGEL